MRIKHSAAADLFLTFSCKINEQHIISQKNYSQSNDGVLDLQKWASQFHVKEHGFSSFTYKKNDIKMTKTIHTDFVNQKPAKLSIKFRPT